MDASHFDRWSRAAATSSRRCVLRGLLVAALGVGVSSLLGPRAAAQTPAPDAAEICRMMDEAGELRPFGLTRGECLNIFKRAPNEQAMNFFAAICGDNQFQSDVGVSSKGECITLLKGLR